VLLTPADKVRIRLISLFGLTQERFSRTMFSAGRMTSRKSESWLASMRW